MQPDEPGLLAATTPPADTLTWDWREQPDLDDLAGILARHSVRLEQVATGRDDYEIRISSDPRQQWTAALRWLSGQIARQSDASDWVTELADQIEAGELSPWADTPEPTGVSLTAAEAGMASLRAAIRDAADIPEPAFRAFDDGDPAPATPCGCRTPDEHSKVTDWLAKEFKRADETMAMLPSSLQPVITRGTNPETPEPATAPAEPAHDSPADDDAPTGTPEGAAAILGRALLTRDGHLLTRSPDSRAAWGSGFVRSLVRAHAEDLYGAREVLLVSPAAAKALDALLAWRRASLTGDGVSSYEVRVMAAAVDAMVGDRPACPECGGAADRTKSGLFCEECNTRFVVGDHPAEPAPERVGEPEIVQMEDLPEEIQERAVHLSVMGDKAGMMRVLQEAVNKIRAERAAPEPWRCEHCGSTRWVGWRAGPAHEGFPRKAQCVRCGHVQEPPVAEPAPEPDSGTGWEGRPDRECGDHRTCGGRAWCYDDTEWCSSTAPCRGCQLPSLAAELAEVTAERERLRQFTATCQCEGHPANYEGPQADCPVHGAVRAFNEATRELARLRDELDSTRTAYRMTDDMLQATAATADQLRAESATARRDAAADALEYLAGTYNSRDSGYDMQRRALNFAADVRAGTRTVPGQPEPATSQEPDDATDS